MSMEGSVFIFCSIQFLYYKCDKVSFRHSLSYIDYTDWIKKKKATIHSKNANDNCFKFAVTLKSNYEETESRAERISNIKLFMNKYNWEGINYP